MHPYLKILVQTFIVGFLCHNLYSQDFERKICSAINTITEPDIDGMLNDKIWEKGDWEGGFIQYEPYNGQKPGQETEFKVLYNDNALFVAIRAFDLYPDSISYRLTRRDVIDGDFVAFTIDTYHDLKTAFAFYINAAGVKSDEFYYNNGELSDLSWNPVWYGKTSSDKNGWYAELKIPLSQLRFKNDTSLVWGLSVMRRIFRYSETDLWVPLPKDAPGWIHLMGELNNIHAQARRQFDVTPYIKGSLDSRSPDRYTASAGLDGKAALTTNLIMDYTINPDFGQVEADPSVVNLSVYETYFEEKRPFFIEGNNITSFPIDMGNDMDNLFYSRRIGRRPRNYPVLDTGDSLVFPAATNIIGAAKITGKNNKGLSLGIIEGVTAHEYAEIVNDEDRRKVTAEPLTNYFISRINKEYNKGESEIGGIFTATNRVLNNDTAVFWMPEASYTGGVNFTRTFDNRNYQVDANFYFSHVTGKEESITYLQLSPVRYFQRPGFNHVKLDTNRNSLTGTGGNISFTKSGKGHFNYLAYIRWNSPELELNDVGYIRSADLITQIFWMGYHIWEPRGIFKDLDFNLTQWSSWNFGGNNTIIGFNANSRLLFKNNWSIICLVNSNFNIRDQHLLRGGPAYRMNQRGRASVMINSDNRKSFFSTLSISLIQGRFKQRSGYDASLEFNYKPNQRLNIGFQPEYSTLSDEQQYVTTVDVNAKNTYILGRIDQKTLSASLRVNYTFLPDLTLEYWGQPFVSKGLYTNFKEVTNPASGDINERYIKYSETQISKSGDSYVVDNDLDGSDDFEFGNPDFTLREFLNNLVLRWEFKPGSTLFFVWNQTRSNYINEPGSGLSAEFETLINTTPRNVFLIKLSFRIGR